MTTKTHAEFLEELELHVQSRINIRKEVMGEDYSDTTTRELEQFLKKIEQFKAEVKANENK